MSVHVNRVIAHTETEITRKQQQQSKHQTNKRTFDGQR